MFQENLKIFKMIKAVVHLFMRALQIHVSFPFRVLLSLQYLLLN
jgi:hypothetical protein